jgi:hypothetical protein
MEPVEVTVRYDVKGKAYPEQFVWKRQPYQVTSTGRRWQDEAGWHVLVMTAQARTYELVFDPPALRWYLKTPQASPKIGLST